MNSCSIIMKVSGSEMSLSNFKDAEIENNYETHNKIFESVLCICETIFVIDSVYEDTGVTLILKFYSGYDPPLLELKLLSQNYPDLYFEIDYWGLGNGFCGECRFKNGEIVHSEYFENDEYDALFHSVPIQPDSPPEEMEDNSPEEKLVGYFKPVVTCKTPVSELHKAALEYASKGIAVFPLVPNTKKKLFRNGGKDATVNKLVIDEWWTKEPLANIGMSTSEYIVLDVDNNNGINGFDSLDGLENKYGPLPFTLTQTTPSGGQHIIFRNIFDHHIPSRKNCPVPGIDSRGNGGYVVVGPSVINGVPYVMSNDFILAAPEWLCYAIKFMPINFDIQNGSIRGGSRKRFLFDVASECRRDGFTAEQAEEKLQYANLKCEPPFELMDLEVYREIATEPFPDNFPCPQVT